MSAGFDDDLTGQVLGKRYRLERKLASGGMGVVYAAIDTRIDRKVAVKIVHAHLAHDAGIVARFRREAEAAGGLEHPHIVQITDFVEADGAPPFLVMELLQGEPLSEVLRRERTLSMQRTAFIAWQMLDALDAAHAAGIVHRDLKPANIFLTTVAGVRDVVKVVDFGVAKLRESATKITKLGDMIGTPAFMAPEQVKGEEVDGRADLYAVGVVMYGCLAGSPPFWSADPSETLRLVLKHQFAPLVSVAPGVDPALASVVERALSERPEDRHADAAAMRAALVPWAGSADAHMPSTPSPAPSAADPAQSTGRQSVPDLSTGRLTVPERPAAMAPRAPSGAPASASPTGASGGGASSPDMASTPVDPHGPSNPGREDDGMRPRTLVVAAIASVIAAAVVYFAAQQLQEAPRESTAAPPPAELLTPAQRRFVVEPSLGRGLFVRVLADAGPADAQSANDGGDAATPAAALP